MSHDKLTETCCRCDFWTGDKKKKEGQGQCRRYPPQNAGVVPTQNLAGQVQPSIIAGFPSTRASEWCGEFKQGTVLETIN